MTEKTIVLSQKTTNKRESLNAAKKAELEYLFLMDGITAYAASKHVGCKRETAVRYFDQWAEALLQDPDHETWAYRQKCVRVRALEGYTRKIMSVTKQKGDMERIVGNLMYKEKTTGKGKTEKKTLVLKDPDSMDHAVILGYQGRITNVNQQLMELQEAYDAIDSKPPAEIILKQEFMQMLNESKTQ